MGAAYKTNLRPIIKSQKKFLKILFKKKRRFSTEQLYRETKVLKLEEMYKISTLKYIKKEGIIQTRGDEKKITRNNQLAVTLPRVRTNVRKMNSIYRGIQNFNELKTWGQNEDIKGRCKKIQIDNTTKNTKTGTH